MTVHPVRSARELSAPTQRPTPTDTTSTASSGALRDSSVYDSTWAETRETAPPRSSTFEDVMVSSGKIYVVLAVVLIIWIGLVALLFRTDRRIDRLEEKIESESKTTDPQNP